MAKTAKGLVAWATGYLGEAYWYGTFGQDCSESLYNAKKRQYPKHYTASRANRYKQDIAAGKRCADCVGLIKGYLWEQDGKIKYDGDTDVSANGMYNAAKEKGTISLLPDIPGLLLWCNGHIGIYIGGGEAIEARGFAYGVVKTRVSARSWTNWCKCPWITYDATDAENEPQESPTRPTLRKGSKGAAVKEAQTLLMRHGQALPKYGADGDFGMETYNAVRSFQLENDLAVDGIIGKNTWSALDNEFIIVNKVIGVGSRVKIKPGAKDYNGKSLAAFVYEGSYTVDERNGQRCVLDKKGIYTPMHVDDLIVQ